jgi:hypothetical protein
MHAEPVTALDEEIAQLILTAMGLTWVLLTLAHRFLG